MSISLKQHLLELSIRRGVEEPLCFTENNPKYPDYFAFKPSFCLINHAAGVIAGAGKSKYPAVLLDKYIRPALNDAKYFSTSPGKEFRNQKQAVEEALKAKKPAAFVLVDPYNLQGNTTRSRLWTVDLHPRGLKELEIYAVCGHSSLLPMAPYDILTAATMAFAVAREMKKTIISFNWYFPRMSAESLPHPVNFEYLNSEIPKQPFYEYEATQFLKAEASLRRVPTATPVVEMASSELYINYARQIQELYQKNPPPRN